MHPIPNCISGLARITGNTPSKRIYLIAIILTHFFYAVYSRQSTKKQVLFCAKQQRSTEIKTEIRAS